MTTRASLLAGVIALVLAGCHRVTFVNTGVAQDEDPVFEKRLNSAIVADVVEIDPPVRLATRCPDGWARIETKRSVYTVLLEMLGGWVYSGRSFDLYCGEGSSDDSAGVGDDLANPQAAQPVPPDEPATEPDDSAAEPPESPTEGEVLDI